MDEESKYSSKSKRSALGCCLAFAWFFASFSLAFLVKVLLIKRACNHISYLSLYHSSFACCISKKLIKRNGNLSYWNFRKSGLIFEVPASLKHSSWASSKKMTSMNVGRMKKLPAIFVTLYKRSTSETAVLRCFENFCRNFRQTIRRITWLKFICRPKSYKNDISRKLFAHQHELFLLMLFCFLPMSLICETTS